MNKQGFIKYSVIDTKLLIYRSLYFYIMEESGNKIQKNNKQKRAYDVLGNIAIVNFPEELSEKEKKEFAKGILDERKEIKTVLEKSGKFRGRLRKMETKHLAGDKNKEVLYRENGCVFRFNIDKTYFSPRLSNERKDISNKIQKGDRVLVMFAGVAPFSIVIAKNSSVAEVISNEINKEAVKYAKQNIELNKLKNKVELNQGDIKKEAPKLKKKENFKGFDVIVMPRPQLEDTFLKEAFMLSKNYSFFDKINIFKNKKPTRIYYYDFCKIDEIQNIINKIKKEASKAGRKIKILNTKKAGELAPYKIRLRVDFKVY